MFNSIRAIFRSRHQTKDSVSFRDQDIKDAVKTNRNSLLSIDNWIDEAAFKKSWFQYGVPDFIRSNINKKISTSPTYTDYMVVLARNYFNRLNYLEIGVSVGKNFFQIMRAFPEGEMTGFDIEEINPILEHQLTLIKTDEWETTPVSMKKNNSSLKTYHHGNQSVHYLCADVWDELSWARLEGNKYNLVFSDALHSPEAILFEFEMLVKYKLLDEKFVIVWDDLVGKMKNSFFRIIKKYHVQYNIQNTYLIQVNGWIGEHEGPHSVGIISNFPFK